FAGVHGVRLVREDGVIDLTRIDDDSIVQKLPGDETGQHVTMPRRTLPELVTEELRRLDADEVYGEVLASTYSSIDDSATFATGKPEPRDVVAPDADAVAAAAASATVARLAAGLEARPPAPLVRTGGTAGTKTAAAPPEARHAAGVDCSRLHLRWGDERYVEPDSEERNEVGVRESLLAPLQERGLPARQIHVMPSPADGMSLDDAAAWYGQQLDQTGGDEPFRTRGRAFFDVLLLGVGPDGHIASLFPEHPGQRRVSASATGVTDSPKPPPERISLTWPVLNSSRHVALMVAGAEQAGAVRDGHGQIDPWLVPAPAVGGLDSTPWYLDEAAAATSR